MLWDCIDWINKPVSSNSILGRSLTLTCFLFCKVGVDLETLNLEKLSEFRREKEFMTSVCGFWIRQKCQGGHLQIGKASIKGQH